MPEITTIEKMGHIRHIIKVQPGEHLELCRCQQSKTYPFCDGAHRTMQNTIGPAILDVVEGAAEQE
jgi:CDGSH-type Zn-finger protein